MRASKAWKIVIIVLVITLIPITVYGINQYYHIKRSVDDMQITIDETTDPAEETEDLSEEPLSFLLLGIGDRPGDPGRADSIIIVSINPEKEEILTFNIPRDTKTEIIGKGIETKINHSYAYGGTKMTVNTVESFLDHDFDYVVQVNMQGLRDLVDALGGIEVDNPFYFYQKDELGKETHYYDEGPIELNGERALHYSRMRKQDPRGDFGRNERQKQVIQAILKKAKSPRTLFTIKDTMKALSGNVETNVSFDNIKKFYKEYKNSWHKYELTDMEFETEDSLENHVSYILISDEERDKMRQILKDHSKK